VNRETQSTQKEGEGSKRRKTIDVHGVPVERKREEERRTTLTSYELVIK